MPRRIKFINVLYYQDSPISFVKISNPSDEIIPETWFSNF